jgi:hypothetical protein
MRFCTKINSFLGLLAAGLLSIFGKKPARPGLDDLKRAEFTTSTQRLGVRFTERVRDVFRFKWLKVSHKNHPGQDNRPQQSKEARPDESIQDSE